MHIAGVKGTLATMQDDWHLNYLRDVLTSTGWTASRLAKEIGVASTTLTRALNSPSHKFNLSLTTLDKIRERTRIPFPSAVAGASHNASPLNPDASKPNVLIPVYDVAASAGDGAIVDAEPVVAHMALSRDYLRSEIGSAAKNLKVIKVQGHSMEPTLNHGDLVMIDVTKRDLNFDGLFVVRFGDALQVKRIGRSPTRGQVELISDNPAYGRRDWAVDDLDPIGRVLWVGKKV
jgi:phage repressor protein C with HTH and peptisase S24 domain